MLPISFGILPPNLFHIKSLPNTGGKSIRKEQKPYALIKILLKLSSYKQIRFFIYQLKVTVTLSVLVFKVLTIFPCGIVDQAQGLNFQIDSYLAFA